MLCTVLIAVFTAMNKKLSLVAETVTFRGNYEWYSYYKKDQAQGAIRAHRRGTKFILRESRKGEYQWKSTWQGEGGEMGSQRKRK